MKSLKIIFAMGSLMLGHQVLADAAQGEGGLAAFSSSISFNDSFQDQDAPNLVMTRTTKNQYIISVKGASKNEFSQIPTNCSGFFDNAGSELIQINCMFELSPGYTITPYLNGGSSFKVETRNGENQTKILKQLIVTPSPQGGFNVFYYFSTFRAGGDQKPNQENITFMNQEMFVD